MCKEISQELGFTKMLRLERGKLRHVGEQQLEGQKVINLAIKAALRQGCKTSDDLERRLHEKGIECTFLVEKGGIEIFQLSLQRSAD